ncbi:MAG: hypothetical protein ACYSUD_21540 [Planctomycetota bacterium]
MSAPIQASSIASVPRLGHEPSAGDQAVGWLSSFPSIGEFFSVLIRYEAYQTSRFGSKIVLTFRDDPGKHSAGTREAGSFSRSVKDEPLLHTTYQ